MKIKIFAILFLILTNVYSQNIDNDVEKKINQIALTNPGLDEKIRIDVVGLTLYDLLTSIAEEHQLNVSAEPSLQQLITSNFYDIKVKDIFLFLIKEYNLKVNFTNGIMVFKKKPIIPKPEPVVVPKKIDVSYNAENDFLSVHLENDSLPLVARAITDISSKNIILSPSVKKKKISGYILNRPFDQVIEMLAKSNALKATQDENGFYYLDDLEAIDQNSGDSKNRNLIGRNSQKNIGGDFFISINNQINNQLGLDVEAYEANAAELIRAASRELNVSFFMYDTPSDVQTTLFAKGITFEDLLKNIFKGDKYTFKKVDDLYLIGEHHTEGLRKTELIQMENRTIETVLSTLPAKITENLEVKEFIDLNGFVVSGSRIQIEEFRNYIHEIDQVVPVIQIEVIIVQYDKGYDISTGIQMGIDKETRTTSGVLFPTTDMSLNSTSVNDLIDAFNGFGWVNLGKVASDFYANLKMMENNSLIKISSTPKLVTLNGHEAISSIGETNYYFEQNNRLINTGITDNILQSGTWKSTDASLSIYIKPFVSKDENVTLNIKVEKSSFLGRAGETAPPGKATQSFESIVRVRNNEMVLLGGLDEMERENSGTGAPLLSRIPILKWFFSNRTKRKETSKLHIFIKPTIIY